MNGSAYLKFILTLLTLSVMIFGYLGVSSLDQLHRVNVRLLEKLEKGGLTVEKQTPSASPAEKIRAEGSAKIANRQFFDSAAVPGGRLIRAIEAEPPNLNPIVCNEATTSVLYGLCSVSLAARNWEKPEVFEPMLAESWQISADHKQYRIKLRRGVLWQPHRSRNTSRMGATVLMPLKAIFSTAQKRWPRKRA